MTVRNSTRHQAYGICPEGKKWTKIMKKDNIPEGVPIEDHTKTSVEKVEIPEPAPESEVGVVTPMPVFQRALEALQRRNLSLRNLSLRNLSLRNLSLRNLSLRNLSLRNLLLRNLSLRNLLLRNLLLRNMMMKKRKAEVSMFNLTMFVHALHANRLSVSRCALHLLREFENNLMRI